MTTKAATYKHTLAPVDGRTIRVERVFDAPRDLVWRAYTEPELLAQWWGRGNRVDVERFEFERGGHWRFVEHWDGGSAGFEGRFREIEPKTLISQTFEWDGAPGHPLVDTAEFSDEGGGRATRIAITSRAFDEQDAEAMMQAGAESGMAQSYDALDALLARLQGKP